MGKDDVVIEPLDLTNYSTWSIRMKALLIDKGLWAAVKHDPELAQAPAAAGGVEAAGGAAGVTTAAAGGAGAAGTVTREKSERAQAQIMLHVRDHHLAALNACSSAKQAWDTLERTYMAKSNARKLQLRMELSNLKMASGEPLAKYVARARQLRNDLAATGHIIPASDLVWSVLGGLPSVESRCIRSHHATVST